MTYTKLETLDSKWNGFEEKLHACMDMSRYHLRDIQKLMTAEFVVDITAHAIYTHTKYVHQLTLELLRMRQEILSKNITELCQLWTDILEHRNLTPLKIKHNKRLDATCSFDLSLQMIQGLPYGFKNIRILDSNNERELEEVIFEIKYLGHLAHGFSFAGLPWMENKVLTSLLKYKDTKCFLAIDKNEQIVGYSWGLMLRDVETPDGTKVNVFWVMDLAKNPDFYDPEVKIGEALREAIKDTLVVEPDCHFLGYQHILNHKFHVGIVDGGVPKTDETIKLGDNQYQAKSMVEYEIDEFRTIHIIRAQGNTYSYPEYKVIEPAIFSAFKNAAPDIIDFVLGGALVFGRMYYQQWTHSMLEAPIEHRIEEPISFQQDQSDLRLLKTIILDEVWDEQGSVLFFQKCIPSHIQALRAKEDYDFNALKQELVGKSWSLSRSPVTICFYDAVIQSSHATDALNRLINNPVTPKAWVVIIREGRCALTQQSSEVLAI